MRSYSWPGPVGLASLARLKQAQCRSVMLSPGGSRASAGVGGGTTVAVLRRASGGRARSSSAREWEYRSPRRTDYRSRRHAQGILLGRRSPASATPRRSCGQADATAGWMRGRRRPRSSSQQRAGRWARGRDGCLLAGSVPAGGAAARD